MKKIHSFFIKNLILALSTISLSSFFWNIIYLINKLFHNPIKSVFICYPAHSKYTKYFFYDWLSERMKWKFVLIGIHKQNGYWGLNLTTPVDESELISDKNIEKFETMINKMIDIKEKTAIEYINYAGILPSVISKRKLSSFQSATRNIIAEVVASGIFQTLDHESYDVNDTEIYILGGKGFIGKSIVDFLNNKNIDCNILDIEDYDIINKLKKSRKQKIIVNVSRRGVFEQYSSLLCPKTILLNEVYPEPCLDNCKIKSAYHVKGIKAKMYPSLPYGYSNALPCCALVQGKDKKYQVIIKKI